MANVLQAVSEILLGKRAQDPDFQPGGKLAGRKLILVLDNAPWHKAGLKQFKSSAWAVEHRVHDFIEFKYDVPMSPELNKVVEHYHGAACSAFRRALGGLQPQALQVEQLTELYRQQWFMFGQPAYLKGVRRDFRSLKQTYAEIVRHGGGRVARKFS
jgi:hypothetical protein